MVHKKNKFKCIECAIVILFISILLVSSVSADPVNNSNSAGNNHSKKVSSRLEKYAAIDTLSSSLQLESFIYH
jgi:competence protein ComGC